MKPLSLRGRLALFYAVVLVAVLAAFTADIWWVEGRIGLRRVDRELEGLSASVATMIRDELAEHASIEDAATEVSHVVATPERAVAIVDRGGRPIGASWGRLEWKAPPQPAAGLQVDTVRTSHGAWRVASSIRSVNSGDALVGPTRTSAAASRWLSVWQATVNRT